MKAFVVTIVILTFGFGFSQSKEAQWLYDIQQHRIGSIAFHNTISKLATPLSILTPIGTFSYGHFSKNNEYKRKGLYTFIGISSAMSISTVLKYTIKRARPYETYSFITRYGNDFTPSFPSGHTTSAFATAANLSLICPKWYVIVPAYLWASLEAYSRMALGVHYPTDILGGIVVGSAFSYGSYYLSKKYFEKRTLKRNSNDIVWK